MARFVAKSEVVEVFARGSVRIDPGFAEANDVDTAVIVLEHENGCFTTIDNSRQAVYGYDQRVEVFGSKGMAASENPLANAAILRTAEGMRAATLPYFYLERYIPSYLREWEAFVGALVAGTPPVVGPRDARAPLVIGLAAWQSLREGRSCSIR
jgi:myo-inositol 2-dehydrogenase/D-chiro-inositol 1-dehydrogenase